MALRRLSFSAYLAWDYSTNACNNVPFQVPQGDDWEFVINVYDHEYEPITITNILAFKWGLFPVSEDEDAIITREMGVDTVTLATNTISFDVPAETTLALSGVYYHEAQIITSQECRYNLLHGYLKVCARRIHLSVPT